MRGEVVGADAGERAAVGAHRGAHRVDYVGLGHAGIKGDRDRRRILARGAFVLGTLGMLAFIVGVLVLVGHFYPGSDADLVDWKPTRSPEVEAQNEIDDVRQMIEAQNEMRRRRGAPEMTRRSCSARSPRTSWSACAARSVRGLVAAALWRGR